MLRGPYKKRPRPLSKLCNSCNKILPYTEENFRKRNKDATILYSICLPCVAKRQRAFRAKHSDKIKAQKNAFRKNNREHVLAQEHANYQRHKEIKNQRSRLYYEANREEGIKKRREWYMSNKESVKDKCARLRLEALKHYSQAEVPYCKCCNESIINFLTIDHINGGGTKHRKEVTSSSRLGLFLAKNNYPEGYQILCYNCNCSKGSGDICKGHNKELA